MYPSVLHVQVAACQYLLVWFIFKMNFRLHSKLGWGTKKKRFKSVWLTLTSLWGALNKLRYLTLWESERVGFSKQSAFGMDIPGVFNFITPPVHLCDHMMTPARPRALPFTAVVSLHCHIAPVTLLGEMLYEQIDVRRPQLHKWRPRL